MDTTQIEIDLAAAREENARLRAALSRAVDTLDAGASIHPDTWLQKAMRAALDIDAITPTVRAQERNSIIQALREEADITPCSEDASVVRRCADLVEHDFDYEAVEAARIRAGGVGASLMPAANRACTAYPINGCAHPQFCRDKCTGVPR